ncbi:hypothetical protein Taro_052809 [Colocasia esculenta]|uniref:Uncharacterized protein n=1 Tax=Colocasia esculenta TaxID=4460 RepID=A0A843XJI3_COLES|nr:hypothetical protein [Colocasia esculenta]
MATLGLRRPGEQVSTLTSGTCPPPEFPPNALRVTTHCTFSGGLFPDTVPLPSAEAVSHLAQVGQEGHQTVGDSSPMGELACSWNSGLCNSCRSEKLASTSLDAGLSVGIHRVDAYTTQASIDIDANLAFGQNSKTCRNHAHFTPIYMPYVYVIMYTLSSYHSYTIYI